MSLMARCRDLLHRPLRWLPEENLLYLTADRELTVMQGANLPPFVQGMNTHTKEQQIEAANLLFQGALIMANAAGVVIALQPTQLPVATNQPRPVAPEVPV